MTFELETCGVGLEKRDVLSEMPSLLVSALPTGWWRGVPRKAEFRKGGTFSECPPEVWDCGKGRSKQRGDHTPRPDLSDGPTEGREIAP